MLLGWCIYRLYNHAGELIYVGQTRRAAVARWAEHLRDQPWAHEIATMQADSTVYGSERDVLAAERHAIHAELPIYNGTHNGRNPHRVVVQRAGRPAQRSSWRRTYVIPWHRRASTKLGALVAIWVTLFGMIWWLVSPKVTAHQGAELSAVTTTISFIVAYRTTRPRRRRR